MTLSELIAAYTSRLDSYEFLLHKIEQEQRHSRDVAFAQFCECEEKRLLDLIQLTSQILRDLRALQRHAAPAVQPPAALPGPSPS